MDWDDIDIPWLENENFADLVLDKVCWDEILEECGVDYRSNGDNSYKVRCPFHADGNERTPSLSASEDKNTFYCFACASAGNKIEFVSKIFGIPYHKAIEWVASLAGITSSDFDPSQVRVRKRRAPEETVAFYVHRAGVLLRDTLSLMESNKDYPKWEVWVNKKFKRLDDCLDMDDDNWSKAKEYLEYLDKKIKQRLG